MPKFEKGERVTPRVLVRIDLEKTPARKPQTRFEAQTPNGTIHGGNNYEKTVVGFAELPANTKLSRRDSAEEFRNDIESVAQYVHWKPNADIVGDSGENVEEP